MDPILTCETAAEHFGEAARLLPPYPGGFSGRGIVMAAGGFRYFPCAWVCIKMLRRLGCSLAIELWHLGPAEMTREMRELIEPLGVRLVDAMAVRERYPARILKGWELKPYAIIHSRFQEILFLDSDNVPVMDPTFLFDNALYRHLGSIFWPDFERMGPERDAWHLAGVRYRDEPEFETGQILVSKQKCWAALTLTMWMNEHSDFWYNYVHGDKETFHLSWRKLNLPYPMPPRGIEPLEGVMCQHDFFDRRLFQHRNMAKWTLAENRHIDGFMLEDECFAILDELRHRWEPLRSAAPGLTSSDRVQMCGISGQRFKYRRDRHDLKLIRLAENGIITEGAGSAETLWWLEHGELVIASDNGRPTCRLRPALAGAWTGHCLESERMTTTLEPLK